jgi:hypothetical protein
VTAQDELRPTLTTETGAPPVDPERRDGRSSVGCCSCRTSASARSSPASTASASPTRSWRDLRGFALKFSSEDGNDGQAGKNGQVFFIKDLGKSPNPTSGSRRAGPTMALIGRCCADLDHIDKCKCTPGLRRLRQALGDRGQGAAR